jgi:hypothetical protein
MWSPFKDRVRWRHRVMLLLLSGHIVWGPVGGCVWLLKNYAVSEQLKGNVARRPVECHPKWGPYQVKANNFKYHVRNSRMLGHTEKFIFRISICLCYERNILSYYIKVRIRLGQDMLFYVNFVGCSLDYVMVRIWGPQKKCNGTLKSRRQNRY